METVYFLKTYLNDLKRTRSLLESYYDNNHDARFYICCKKTEFDILNDMTACKGIIFIDEKELLLKEEMSLPGYIQQQLIKLRVFNIANSTNFLILDSDVQFINKLRQTDFQDFQGNLYSFVDFDLDIEIMRDWTNRYRANRRRYLCNISEFYGISKFPSAHGITNFISPYLKEMNEYIQKSGKNLSSLIHDAPLEFSWYFGYCAFAGLDLRLAPKPIYTFHTARQYELLYSEIDYDAFKESYFGYVLNSNWADAYDVWSLGDKLSHINYIKSKIVRKTKGTTR